LKLDIGPQAFLAHFGWVYTKKRLLERDLPQIIESLDLDSDKKEEVAFTFSSLRAFKPWVAALLLSNQNMLKLMGETGGVELSMARLFTEEKKIVGYLETTREVFDIYDKAPDFDTKEFHKLLLISTSARDFQFFKDDMLNIVMPEKIRFINHNKKYPKNVVSRNELWLPKIKDIAESLDIQYKKCLIIVGFGHLMGKYGIIARLKNSDILKGWQLRK